MLREDRRRAPRHGCSDIQAQLKIVSWYMFLMPPKQVNAIDFHAQGMSFVSNKAFKPNQEIVLFLDNPYHKVKELPGRISYCNKLGNGFHCGVEFILHDESKLNQMASILKIIEDQLKEANHVKNLALFFNYDQGHGIA